MLEDAEEAMADILALLQNDETAEMMKLLTK